jgi:predicted RNA-binding protein with RPS1 domain
MKEKLIDFVNDWHNVLTDDELEKIVIILVKSLEENDKMQLSIKHQQLQEFILDKLKNGNKQTK